MSTPAPRRSPASMVGGLLGSGVGFALYVVAFVVTFGVLFAAIYFGVWQLLLAIPGAFGFAHAVGGAMRETVRDSLSRHLWIRTEPDPVAPGQFLVVTIGASQWAAVAGDDLTVEVQKVTRTVTSSGEEVEVTFSYTTFESAEFEFVPGPDGLPCHQLTVAIPAHARPSDSDYGWLVQVVQHTPLALDPIARKQFTVVAPEVEEPREEDSPARSGEASGPAPARPAHVPRPPFAPAMLTPEQLHERALVVAERKRRALAEAGMSPADDSTS
ncbi:MAG: hypothetical protein ACT4PP_01535 [Sporichthyaceae bacterium]